MLGLVNTSIQCFLRDSYGAATWAEVTQRAGLQVTEFEAMLTYGDDLTWRLLDAGSQVLSRDRDDLLEDLGTYLVSHENSQRLRRLLRFAGVGYEDFLHSLDELPDRARLAVSDLVLPAMDLQPGPSGQYTLRIAEGLPGFGHVMVGILRAMADDYGALVTLEYRGAADGVERVEIQLVETAFAEGRSFELGADPECLVR